MEISVYAVYPDRCGRSYPYIFVYADVTVSEPVFFRARFSKMAASRNVVCSMLLGLLSSLIACLELNVAMLNLNFNYLRRRLSVMRLLAISDSGIRRSNASSFVQTNELSLVFFCFSLNETFFMVFFNRTFFRSSSSHVLKPQVNKQENREFGAKIIAGSAFFVMRMLC